ncbi:hypothetical protein BDZ85DRAFT_250611 [Elsinoe ampelina]|uniref:Uncharacterized protein n=1 Tax=Elsinoe ampelina TaxID=302913 RepID=A0A6A6GAM5_9PEZI|nr:hypothetical protein BDZ85DRAFT_250611 [Elsinoe ampelina]
MASLVAATASHPCYNSLRPIEHQVRLQDSHGDHVKALLALVNDHGMADHFGVHSLHNHGPIPEKTICLETDLPGYENIKWNRSTPVTDQLLTQKIHPTLFRVNGADVIPFEFALGPSPIDASAIPKAFVADLVEYLTENDLTDLIAIQLGDFTKAGAAEGIQRTSELEVDWGAKETLTVILPFERMVDAALNPVPTGWNAANDIEHSSPPAGEHWNESKKADGSVTHKVHVDSTEAITPANLMQALIRVGYCKP